MEMKWKNGSTFKVEVNGILQTLSEKLLLKQSHDSSMVLFSRCPRRCGKQENHVTKETRAQTDIHFINPTPVNSKK